MNNVARVNNVARAELIGELEHLLQHRPTMGTLYMTVRRTPHMLVVTLEDGEISLAYPHTGRFDVLRTYRFASFCKANGFTLQKKWWWKIR